MVVVTRLFGTLNETLEAPLTGSGSGATRARHQQPPVPGAAGDRAPRAPDVAPASRDPVRRRRDAVGRGTRPHVADPGVAGQIVGSSAQSGRPRRRRTPPRATRQRPDRPGRARARVPVPARRDPGGVLLAGKRVLARIAQARTQRRPRSAALETAAIAALGNNYAGIVAMDPRTGGLAALAGIAFSAPQPPGSTMKIVTRPRPSGRDREAEHGVPLQHGRRSTATRSTTPAAKTAAARC